MERGVSRLTMHHGPKQSRITQYHGLSQECDPLLTPQGALTSAVGLFNVDRSMA